MGIDCEIVISEPINGQFVPGSDVCGVIKYGFDENIILKKTIVSLKGVGRLIMSKSEGDGNPLNKTHYYNREDYVDVHNVVQDEEKGLPVCSGQRFETHFTFQLPQSIPSSMNFVKSLGRYKISCNITYYVLVQFEIPNYLKFNKVFQTVPVVAGTIHSTEPIMHHQRKKLFHLMEKKESFIDITTSLKRSILCPSGKIKLDCEVKNMSNITVKSIEAKLVEVLTFYPKTLNGVKFTDADKDTGSKIGRIGGGKSRHMSFELMLPAGLHVIKHAKIVSRDYSVLITVELPFPHRNFVFEVPVKIGDKLADAGPAGDPNGENQILEIDGVTYDAPPPYYQLMS